MDSLSSDQIEIAIIALLVACAVVMVVVLRTVQKAVTRLALLGIVLVIGLGLWWQREELRDCRDTCTCRVFGQDVKMSDVDVAGLNCPE